jgi:hypothetical protein
MAPLVLPVRGGTRDMLTGGGTSGGTGCPVLLTAMVMVAILPR